MRRVAFAAFVLLGTASPVIAGGAGDDPKEILAAQLRDQGYDCDQPQSASQDMKASKPDEAVWVVQCEKAKYRVHLVPDMAARIERIE
jgi:hypothetical protein